MWNSGWGNTEEDGRDEEKNQGNSLASESKKRDRSDQSSWGNEESDIKKKVKSEQKGWSQVGNDDKKQNDSGSSSWGQSGNEDRKRNDGVQGGWGNSGNEDRKRDGGNQGGWGNAGNGYRKRNNNVQGSWDNSGNEDRKRDGGNQGGWGNAGNGYRKRNNNVQGSWDNSGNEDRKRDDGNLGGWGHDGNEDKKQSDNRKSSWAGRKTDDKTDDDHEPYRPSEEASDFTFEEVGDNFDALTNEKVTCLPPDLVKPIQKFEDAITSKKLLEIIEKQKYKSMTPIQKWAIPAIIEGHDFIACAQTGSGKTAAFLLPILQHLIQSKDLEQLGGECANPYCLVISPTRELARQLYNHSVALSQDTEVKSCFVYGQVETRFLKDKLSRGCHILVATVGRLKDFVERGWIGFKNIKYVILDEGDRLIDDGFIADIQRFFEHPQMPPKESMQTLFFSATFKPETQKTAKQFLRDNFLFIAVGRVGAANQNITQEFIMTTRPEKKAKLKEILLSLPEDQKCIIFTETKVAADMLAGYFTSLKLSSTSIHGDRKQCQREQAINEFKKGARRFLISSPVGNRGLDLPKVALVINYDLPKEIDEYVHRIGRTGRAGHTGKAISFYDANRDSEIVPELKKILQEANQPIPDIFQESTLLSTTSDNQPQLDSGGRGEETSDDKPQTTNAQTADDGWD